VSNGGLLVGAANKIIEEDTDILSFLFWQLKVPQGGQ